jgi:hypothetical protein
MQFFWGILMFKGQVDNYFVSGFILLVITDLQIHLMAWESCLDCLRCLKVVAVVVEDVAVVVVRR